MKGKWKGWILPGAIAAVFVTALIWAWWPAAALVDVAIVDRGPLEVAVREDGKTRVRERYVVSSPVVGELLRIDLDPGDEVRQGETVLAVLQPTDPALLDARSAFEADARLKMAEAAIRQAEAKVESAEAEVLIAESDFSRAQELFGSEAIAREMFERIEHRARMARAELRSAQFGLEVARFEKRQAEAAFIRTNANSPSSPSDSADPASDSGSTTSGDTQTPVTQEPDPTTATATAPIIMKSPVSGRVLRVFEESAGPVQVGTPLLQIGDPGDLEIEIDVLSEDAVRIQPGTRVIIERWGGEAALRGVVRRVEPSAFVKVSALGVEEQRVNVIVDFQEDPEKLQPLGDGFRIEAAIVVWEAEDVIRVPADSLFRINGTWALFQVVAGRAKTTIVEIGQSDGITTQILSGIDAGATVIRHPGDRIADGTRVEPRPEKQVTE